MNGKMNFIALGTVQYSIVTLSITTAIADSCKKVAVAFDSVVSSLEVLNCQSIQAQVLSASVWCCHVMYLLACLYIR